MDRPLRPAVFFDRDGVLNRDVGYPHRPDQIEWTPGAAEAIARANAAGWLVFVVSNQSGIGRGLFDAAAVESLHDWMAAELEGQGARIDAWNYCPHGPDDGCACRKPKPGMIEELVAAFAVDRARSVLIGDKPSDLAAAQAAGVRGVLFTGGDLDGIVRGFLEV